MPSLREDSFRYPRRTWWQSSAGSFALQSQPCAWCTQFINMAIAVVITGNGRKMELRHSKRAVVQWHAGEAIEKDFLTLILDTKGVPVQLIGAMEGLSLQNAACGLAPRTNGQLKHLAFCS